MMILRLAAHIRANNQTKERKINGFTILIKRGERRKLFGRTSNQIHTASDEHYDAMMIAVDQIDSV